MDLTSWYIIYCLCIGSNIFALTTACKSVSIKSKTRYISPWFSDFNTFLKRIILSCPLNCCKYCISRYVRCASVALRNASKHFFNATVVRCLLSIAFQTIPYAPLPSLLHISYFLNTCFSISSCALAIILLY